jgi:hypothetical protein
MAKMVTGTRLSVSLFVHWLYCQQNVAGDNAVDLAGLGKDQWRALLSWKWKFMIGADNPYR